MYQSISQPIALEIHNQKFILVDNNLLIPLISLNAKQISNIFISIVYKFKNLIDTFI